MDHPPLNLQPFLILFSKTQQFKCYNIFFIKKLTLIISVCTVYVDFIVDFASVTAGFQTKKMCFKKKLSATAFASVVEPY